MGLEMHLEPQVPFFFCFFLLLLTMNHYHQTVVYTVIWALWWFFSLSFTAVWIDPEKFSKYKLQEKSSYGYLCWCPACLSVVTIEVMLKCDIVWQMWQNVWQENFLVIVQWAQRRKFLVTHSVTQCHTLTWSLWSHWTKRRNFLVTPCHIWVHMLDISIWRFFLKSIFWKFF